MRHALTTEQFGLSFVAGYADTLSFIAMSGLFTAHVTGNMVLAAAHLSGQGDSLATANLVMIPVFMLMVGAVTLFARSRLFAGRAPDRLVLWFLLLELVLLVCFCAAGAHVSAAVGFPLRSPGDVIPVATLGVAALAVQNALPRLSGLQRLPTTVMTGNLTQSAIDLTRWLTSWRAGTDVERGEIAQRLRKMAPGVAGFFVGAATAAPMTHWFHFRSLWLACVGLLLTMPACIAGARLTTAHSD
jgi:uncharacterized membrane protein YoaK (UPF0700 family)